MDAKKPNTVFAAAIADEAEDVLLAMRGSLAAAIDAVAAGAAQPGAARADKESLPTLVNSLLRVEARLAELREQQKLGGNDAEARIAAVRSSVTDLLAAAQLHAG